MHISPPGTLLQLTLQNLLTRERFPSYESAIDAILCTEIALETGRRIHAPGWRRDLRSPTRFVERDGFNGRANAI